MICPRCGTQNELGARRCSSCRLAFTRGAADRDVRAGYGGQEIGGYGGGDPEIAYPHGAIDEPRRPKRRFPFGGCLVALLILATTAAVAVAIFLVTSNLVIKPIVRDAAAGEIRDGVRQEVSDQLATHVSLSEAAGEPVDGEITITQAEINERIAETGDLGPFDDVSVELVEGGVTVKLHAYGLSGSYDAALRAENGVLVLDGGDIDGPLGLLAPSDDIEQAVNEEIAAALLDAGYRVDAVTVHEGSLVVVVASGQ